MAQDSSGYHVLGIESSCDDTGVAIVREDGKILSNCINSQLKQHISLGGIIPMLAKEYHLNNIDNVANQAFKVSGLRSVAQDIDAIAVSTRPGLSESLEVGLNYARILAKKYSKPLIPIHHMQAHALMPLLEHRSIRFPFIALLISGGHCILSIVERYNRFHLLGGSLDEAPGDLLDKVARRCRLKNLGEPFDRISGGASLELLSQRTGANRFKYFTGQSSVPLLSSKGCCFSFSGYRGNLEGIYPDIDKLWQTSDRNNLLDELSHLSSSLQRGIIVQLCKKLQRAIYYYRMYWRHANAEAFKDDDKSSLLGFDTLSEDFTHNSLDVVVSGGCSANQYFINSLRRFCHNEIDSSIKVYAPSKSLCNDNGLMVAWNGMLRYKHFRQTLKADKTDVKDQAELTRTFCDRLEDSVIYDKTMMDDVTVEPKSSIGVDLTIDVTDKNFALNKFKDPEFKFSKLEN